MNCLPSTKSPPSYCCATTSLIVLLDELIVEILSRLPVKTLMQFKCVCKSWKTLISHDPSFAKLHLRRSPRNTHLLLRSFRVPDWGNFDYSLISIPVSRLLESPSFMTHHRLYYHVKDITILNDPYYRLSNIDCCNIVGSYNGLICLSGASRNAAANYKDTWFRLWNPATNTLSEKFGYSTNLFRYTFGYDISNDGYKVVAFSSEQDEKVKVFCLTDNVWRDIPPFPVVPFGLCRSRFYCHPFASHGAYVSGTVNWLAIRNIKNMNEYEWNDISVNQFVIVSLVLATETFRQLLPPNGFVEIPPVEPSVTVLMDRLCFSHRFKGTHFVLWMMLEFGVQDSWIQFLKISFQDLQIDYGISDLLEYGSQLFLFPLYLSESDNTLIMASNQPSHAIIYNWRDKRVDQIKSLDNVIMWFQTRDYFESLVSTS
ncbi:putative F-box domain, galactose oxidase/kelch, beta-propeller, F-box associated interaction [Medicago truncatula]|uniref:Putative F-box domain, galactose oxidase/kelch, beta-propeller, F-box associated interaction n=1 Tax=Medicago truncatula TaxID=3880 RepID=A0A396INZ0_MEDTR|nr:putative F-box domain, galactose oxidase/kelch, beta-propeller, F-box associated interaction [Medicago truncatula]